MTPREYDHFDLQLTTSDSGCTAHVLKSPAGSARIGFEWPLSEAGQSWLEDGQPGRDNPQGAAGKEVRRIGSQVFQAVFADQVKTLFRRSLDHSHNTGRGLCIRLRLSQAGRLSRFPWEFLYDDQRGFLALHPGIAVVRFPDIAEPVRPRAAPPIRMLVYGSLPSDCRPLDAAQEWHSLTSALEGLSRQGNLDVQRPETTSLEDLESRLDQNSYHIFHFIGHCRYDPKRQMGQLLLSDAQGSSRPLNAEKLSALLSRQPELRLVVLNCCQGNRADLTNPLSGLAQGLLGLRIPAIVAMQFAVADRVAVDFAGRFYQALGQGLPIEAAVAKTRWGLYLSSQDQSGSRRVAAPSQHAPGAAFKGEDIEWGAPVVYLRSDDGILFDWEPQPSERTSPAAMRSMALLRRGKGRQQPSRLAWLGRLLSAAVILLLGLLIWQAVPDLQDLRLAGKLQSDQDVILLAIASKHLSQEELDRQTKKLDGFQTGRLLVYPKLFEVSSTEPLAVYEEGKSISYDAQADFSTQPDTIADLRRASRIGAFCRDGSMSESTGRGTCSGKKGVRKWRHKPETVVALLCKDNRVVAGSDPAACGSSGAALPIRNSDLDEYAPDR